MEKRVIFTLNGKYSKPGAKLVFTQEDVEYVRESILLGRGFKEIYENKKINAKIYDYIIKHHIHCNEEMPSSTLIRSNNILGYKKLEDFKTEEEMINEPEYTWESLSKHEQKFYLDYERKLRKNRRG